MTWKPTALATVVVLVVGIAVGVLTAKDPETEVRRVSVTAPASAAAPPATTGAAPAAGGAETVAGGGDGAGDGLDPERIEPVLAGGSGAGIEDLLPQERIRLTDNTEGFDSPQWRMGTAYNTEPPEYWQLTVTPPAAKVARFRTRVGFLKGAPAGNSVRVTFYRNDTERENALGAFDVTSASPQKVDIDVTGVQQLLVRFTTEQERFAGNSDGDAQMGMVEPVFE